MHQTPIVVIVLAVAFPLLQHVVRLLLGPRVPGVLPQHAAAFVFPPPQLFYISLVLLFISTLARLTLHLLFFTAGYRVRVRAFCEWSLRFRLVA